MYQMCIVDQPNWERLAIKYGPVQQDEDAQSWTGAVDESVVELVEDDVEQTEIVRVALCGNANPAPPLPQPVEPPPKRHRSHRPGASMITATFESLPARLVETLGPRVRLATRANKDGTPKYINVSAQSGRGAGYQVQHWTGTSHVRLATVSDPAVGGLLVAASALDPSLVRASLCARDWLLDLIDHPEKVDAWIDEVAPKL